VDVASVTVRQILTLFNLQSKTSVPLGTWNPSGYESWRIDKGSMSSLLRGDHTLEVKDSDIDLLGMHLDLAGSFGLSQRGQGKIQGDLLQIPLDTLIESFSGSQSPASGQAQLNFDLTFPLSSLWLQGFTGEVDEYAVNGTVRLFKTWYRVLSVLNLTNYFRFRMPQVAAQGVVYQTLIGHFHFQGGWLRTEDLFLKSPNMNVGVQGSVNMLQKLVDATLRVEMLTFLEDVLKSVPITHWIYKKPSKILFPLLVHVKGSWESPDVF
jgi:uncharacterized protein YhdP